MQYGLYVSLSAQVSLQRRLETIASNIANANTPGYRVDGMTFATELAKAGDANVSFVDEGDGYISRRAGPLITTGNPLDIAVQGDGWLSVRTRPDRLYARRPHDDRREPAARFDDRRIRCSTSPARRSSSIPPPGRR